MLDGLGLHRAAAALRTALCDRKIMRFEAPRLIGVVPNAGRVVERVESHGRHLEVTWDDGIILHTHFRRSTGAWFVHRAGESWRLPHKQVSALIEVRDYVAVCFNATTVETYRGPDEVRHPGLGGVGPDISRPDADLPRCVELLLTYRDQNACLADVLLDPRVMFGLGNVYRSEVLWACELNPRATVASLCEGTATRLVNVGASLVRANLQQPDLVTLPGVAGELAVYGRRAQACHRCGGTVRERATGPAGRSLYWCPGCQVRGDTAPTDYSVAIASSTFIRDALAAG